MTSWQCLVSSTDSWSSCSLDSEIELLEDRAAARTCFPVLIHLGRSGTQLPPLHCTPRLNGLLHPLLQWKSSRKSCGRWEPATWEGDLYTPASSGGTMQGF